MSKKPLKRLPTDELLYRLEDLEDVVGMLRRSVDDLFCAVHCDWSEELVTKREARAVKKALELVQRAEAAADERRQETRDEIERRLSRG